MQSIHRHHLVRFAAAFAMAIFFAPLLAQSSEPGAAPANMAAPVADMQSDEPSPQITDLQRVTDMWDEAVRQRDPYGLDLVLSPKLVDISSAGQVSSRDDMVVRITQKHSPIVSLSQTVARVRVVGSLAIVNGTYAFQFHNDNEGRKQKDETGVYTQVFERLQNTWVCINSQRTALSAENAATGEKKHKSHEKGEMSRDARPSPFNLPSLQP